MAIQYKCSRCQHEWIPRNEEELPKICPKCKTLKWNDRLKVVTPGLIVQEPATLKPEPPCITVRTNSLYFRMMATGIWKPEPMWEMEKQLIIDYRAGSGNSPTWQADFKEWFLEAFQLIPERMYNHIQFLGKGHQLQTAIQESIEKNFGAGLENMVDLLCSEQLELVAKRKGDIGNKPTK